MAINPVTMGLMTTLDGISEIRLPEEWINAVTEEKNRKYALFLMSTDKTIRFIPTGNPKVIKYHVNLSDDKISEDFLQKTLEALLEIKVKTLYNSGVCFVGSECFFDFFIDYPSDEQKIDLIIQTLEKLQSVSDIEHIIYKIE
ncbi:MAG: hypothetical protein ACXAC7_20470 [Candidatus Hodarchaeales archaeon]|jgi:hypothetical protein